MEMHQQAPAQAPAITTMGIAAEMLTLALHALVAGISAAVVAGSLVVVLTVIAA